MSSWRVRALEARDSDSLRVVVRAQFSETQYCVRILEQLDIALTRRDPEYIGHVALQPASQRVLGVLLHGPVAGAKGVVKLHTLVGAGGDVMTALLDSLLAASAERADRMIMCEIADDVSFTCAANALLGCGFTREGRVADYFRDGSALDILVWRGTTR